jgi:hypothetical protein
MKGRRIASIKTAAAPTGGWNARDNLGEMNPKDAVILDNLIPMTTQVALRDGSADHVTGITGEVETLAVYRKADGSNQMFGAAGSSIYDVTAAGTVGAAVQSGLSNARFQTTNFATSGGKFLWLVNGADSPRLYDGTTWTSVTGVSVPAITGVTTSKLVHVNVFQRRLWFTELDSFRIWYLPVDTNGGAASSFDLAPLFSQGGYLVGMGTWTLDSGSGMDDHAVFLSSEGQIAVYQGTDPTDATKWGLVGVYSVGSPIGRRCFASYASDLLIISKDGVLPMSKALASSRVTTAISITDKISQPTTLATTVYETNYGWELAVFPEQNLLILNVPVTGGSQQFVMYTINGSWCRFTGWDATCFVRMGSQLFFGTTGKVVQALVGTSDSGVNIDFEALPSFQYHGGMGLKRYTMARPIIATDNPSLGILLGLNVDFDQTAPVGVPTFPPVSTAVWDASTWDSGLWAGDLTIKKGWQTIGGVGYCAAIHIKGSTGSAQVWWQSTDYVYEMGSGFV